MINHPNLEDQRAEGPDKRPSDFVDDLSFVQKIRRTWRGDNKAGRIAGTILDIGETFLPGYVGRARDLFQSKPKSHTMNWIKNRLKEKSTWTGIVTVLTALGVGLSPEQQEAIVTAGVAIVSAIWVFGKEPQSEDV